MAGQLKQMLLQKIQCIEAKRNKQQRKQQKSKIKGKGEPRKQHATMDLNENGNKKLGGPKSLADEERAIHEAYQVLLTEYHRRKAKRKRESRQVVTKQQNQNEVSEIVEDAFSHIRRK